MIDGAVRSACSLHRGDPVAGILFEGIEVRVEKSCDSFFSYRLSYLSDTLYLLGSYI